MNSKTIKNQIFLIVIFIISIGLLFPTSTGFSQSYLRIDGEIGDGGGTAQTQSSTNDNTAIYVIGGLVVAGILVYALVFKKKQTKNENESDSTSALLTNTEDMLVNNYGSFNYEVKKTQEELPIDIFLGVRENNAVINDKTYLMGVSVRF